MSIFQSIMNGIFGHRGQVAPTGATGGPDHDNAPLSAAPDSAPDARPPRDAVDVMAVLAGMEAASGQKLDWRHSIVDLMKLLGIDSSLPARRELARELGYTASTDDTAAMNVWLHRQVMTKVAENGGTVPPELRA